MIETVQPNRIARRIYRAVLLVTAVFSVTAQAQTAYFSATGTFNTATGATHRFIVDLPNAADTTFRTLSWSGGTNAAGNTIASHGIDSVLTYIDADELGYSNDNLSGTTFDAMLTTTGSQGTLIPPLGPGLGTLTLSNKAGTGGMHWAVDMTRSGEFNFTRSQGFNSTMSSFTWGGSSPGIAKVRLGIPASLITSGVVQGRAGSSLEIVNGGRLQVGSDFELAGVGTMSAGTLSAGGIEYFNGSMIQSGGVNTSQKIVVGHATGETGSFRLSGGSLTTNFADIGRFGSGTFIQDSGAATINSNMVLGVAEGSDGRYFLNDGVLNIAALENGLAGHGTFTQSGGSANIDNVLVGRNPSGSGRYLLGGGTLQANTTIVGEFGPGTFSHVAGHHTTASLMLGQHDIGVGTYTLSGGPLTVSGDITVGALGKGHFTQTGGSNWTTGNVLVATGSESEGTYTLNGGTLTTNLLKPGLNGAGSFVHNGGHVSVNQMSIGEGATGIGRYTLAGNGSISTQNLYVGVAGRGTMTHNGGIVLVDGSFTLIGRDAGSVGRYEQSNGFHQTPELLLGFYAGSSGTYHLSGGQFIAPNHSIIGREGAGTFTQSGGEFTAGELSVGFAAGSSGVYELAGGTLNVTNLLRLNSSGTVHYTGGALQTNTLDIRAGAKVLLTTGGDKVVRTNRLEMFGNAKLDLADNAAIIDYSGPTPMTSIKNLIKLGYAAGGWNGAGILSSAAAADPSMALGYAESSAIFANLPAPFAGQFVDNSSVLILYTRAGDADLNGTVNLADFNRLAANFGQSGMLWIGGDFNYDGLVNLADFNLLAANFGLSAGADGPTSDDWSALAAAVPEPTFVLPMTALFCALHRRRRR